MRRAALGLVVSIAVTACVALPISESTRGTSRTQEESAAITIRPGVTTREEVLLALGEPDAVTETSAFVYSGRTWWRWYGLVVIPYIGPPLPAPIPVPFAGRERGISIRSVRIEFDDRGVVTRVDRKPQ